MLIKKPKEKTKILFFLLLFIVFISLFLVFREKSFLFSLFAYIESLEELLKSTLKDVQHDKTVFGLFIFWFTSFIYGFLHAAGPGHGKSVVTAYLFSEKRNYLDGVILAASLAVTHILNSVILSYLFVLLINNIAPLLDVRLHSYFKTISGSMLMLVGIVLLIKKIISRKNRSEEKTIEKNAISSPLVVGFLTGMIPCPATIFIMTFALGAKMPFVGLFASTGILLGVFALISLVSFLVIRSRDGLQHYVDRKYFKGLENASLVLGYISSIIIILIGLFIFLSSIRL